MTEKSYFELSTIYVSETGKAVLIDEGDSYVYWIPISLIEDPSAFDQAKHGDAITISVEEWFLTKEGIV